MAHTKRLFTLSVCCGALMTAVAYADGDGKPVKGGEQEKVQKGPKDKGEKVSQDKGDKVAQDKGNKESAEKGKAPAEQQKPAQQQQAQQQPRRAPFNERDFSRLKMGPNGPLPADRERSTAAKEALEAARADLSKALGNTGGNSTAQTENELWKDTSYRAAVLAQRRAHADYDNVRRPIFDMLREDSYYKELAKRQGESERVIQSLVLTGRGSFDYLFPHAVAALEMRKRMTREEIIALAQTPEVEDARQRMLMASAKVREIKAGYGSQVNGSAQAARLKEELQVARDNVKQAQAGLNAALQEEAEYDRIRDKYIEEWRRTGTPPTATASN